MTRQDTIHLSGTVVTEPSTHDAPRELVTRTVHHPVTQAAAKKTFERGGQQVHDFAILIHFRDSDGEKRFRTIQCEDSVGCSVGLGEADRVRVTGHFDIRYFGCRQEESPPKFIIEALAVDR